MNAVLNVSRTFAFPADVVFTALVGEIGQWWGGEVTIDATPGGAFTGDGEVGRVKRIEAPQKFTLVLEDTLAMLILQESRDGTELQVLHTRFASGEARDEYVPRWDARLDRLAAILA